ncbi:MAG: GlxA family transcriptional regulator [Paracoccaceae bacterium]|nr:GlxA family transcriptional regulator [Paracoccaceae bacterium]
MHKVGILTLEGFPLMSYASVVEPLRAANLLSQKPLYEVVNITPTGDGTRSSSGICVVGESPFATSSKLDILFVIAGGDPFLVKDKKIFAWLNRLSKFGTIIGGISGGPVILAKAGIMGDRRMTVHWEHAEGLLELDQKIILERSLYVFDRDRMTCAGGTAPLDMMLALISAQQGTVFAQFVSDWFLHTEIRPSGGAQRAGLADRIGSNNAIVLLTIELMDNHLADPLSLTQLAELARISERQLNRVFTNNLGKSTMAYYRFLRIEKAKNLLRNSNLKVSEIAEATGFSNPSHLTGIFSNAYGCPPSEYRLRRF